MEFNKKVNRCIAGLGFILYSEKYVEHIEEDERYLETHFWNGSDVAKSTNEGKIVGIATGTSGSFILEFRKGIPSDDICDSFDYKVVVPIKVCGGKIIVRDLYALLRWEKEFDEDEFIEVEDGTYRITALTSMDEEGYLGYDQEIVFYLNKENDDFRTNWEGIPELFSHEDL